MLGSLRMSLVAGPPL